MRPNTKILLYEYGKFPITKVINIIPFKMVVDEFGNIYEIDEDLNGKLVKDTPLKMGVLYTELTYLQMKMFKALTRDNYYGDVDKYTEDED